MLHRSAVVGALAPQPNAAAGHFVLDNQSNPPMLPQPFGNQAAQQSPLRGWRNWQTH